MMVDGEWVTVSHGGKLHIPDELEYEPEATEAAEFEEALMKAMTEPLDTETTVVSTWGGHHWSWSKSVDAVTDIVEEKTGMAKNVSAHADPKFVDGVWICHVCNSESMDKEMFEEAGVWEECAKNAAALVGEEKTALGRYVAGAEAKQNLDRATDAIKQFREGMQKLGLAAADMNLMMKVTMGELSGVTPEDVARLAKKFPELKPTLDEVKFPQAVLDELKPLKEKQWHRELMRTLDNHYSWGYSSRYSVADRVLDFMDDCVDVLLYKILRIR